MSDASLLYEWLASAGLAKYHAAFEQRGITAESLPRLTMQEYGLVGVESMSDRKRLFQLIQILKSDATLLSAAAAERSNPSNPSHTSNPSNTSNTSSTPANTTTATSPQPQINQSQTTQGITSPSPSTSTSASASSSSAASQLPPSGRRPSAHTATNSTAQGNPPTSQPQSNPPPTQLPRRVSSTSPQLPTLPTVQSNRTPTPDDYTSGARRKSTDPTNAQEPAPSIKEQMVPAQAPRRVSNPTDSSIPDYIDPSQKIRVCVRKRPLNKKELSKQEKDVLGVEYPDTVVVQEPKVKVDLTKYVDQHQFIFDLAFDENCSTAEVYEKTAKPLVSHIFNKGKATCFAYGQTGSGKTFTMMGNRDGIYILAAKDIFQTIQTKYRGQLTMWVSFFEIYGGKLFDLLHDRRRLFAREDGKQQICITGLQEIHVENIDQYLQLMDYGAKVRSTGSTAANADSSRSHAILQVVLKDRNRKLHGKFSFIDLAGSERGADHLENNDRQTRMECAEINKSLLALKECIRALDQESKHTPFRGSKLTQVLKDSFIGNSRTVMIAAVAPSASACEHTLNTLRYAYRVKELGSSANASGNQAGGGAQQSANGPAAYPQNVPAPTHKKLKDPESDEGYEEDYEQDYEDDDVDGGDEYTEDSQYGAPTELNGPQEVEEIVQTHSELLVTIGEEEEDLLVAHREQIDQLMETIKTELALLNKVDGPGFTIDNYVDELDELLLQKVEIIHGLRDRIKTLRSHWRQEEKLTKSFKSLGGN